MVQDVSSRYLRKKGLKYISRSVIFSEAMKGVEVCTELLLQWLCLLVNTLTVLRTDECSFKRQF